MKSVRFLDVVIIGGGVSGLSCAITLGSAEAKMAEAKDKKILVIDAGKSHLNMAELHNVAGVKEGTKGPELLKDLRARAEAYNNVSVKHGIVTEVSGSTGAFEVKTQEDEVFEAGFLVFANGMQTIDVQGIGADVKTHVRAPRPGMVMIENLNGVISEGKYVTGCAAGYGAQTATDIISVWAGKYTVIHDVIKKS